MQGSGDHAEGDAELGERRGELGVDGDEAEVARGGEVGVDGGLKQRGGDSGDGDDGEEGHLQAGVKKAAGTDGEQAEGGESDGVEGAAFAIEKAAEQVEGDHPKRALDGRSEAGEERVAEGGQDGEERGRDARQAQAAGEPEDASGDDGEVKAGDDQHVEGAGALEADAESVGEVSAVAGDHGGEHDGVVLGEAQGSRQAAHGGGKGQKVGTGYLLEGVDAAGEGVSGRGAKAVNLGDGEGRGGRDVLVEEVVGAAPDAVVVVDLGRKQADDGADAVTALKGLGFGLAGLAGRPANGEANTAGDGRLEVFGVGDGFKSGDAEVDALGGLLFGSGGGGFAGIGQVLVDFTADGAGVDDGTFDGAKEAVRECGEGWRGSGMGLD